MKYIFMFYLLVTALLNTSYAIGDFAISGTLAFFTAIFFVVAVLLGIRVVFVIFAAIIKFIRFIIRLREKPVYLAQIDFKYMGSFKRTMSESHKQMAREIIEHDGLLWKTWTENEAEQCAGGWYARYSIEKI